MYIILKIQLFKDLETSIVVKALVVCDRCKSDPTPGTYQD